VLEECTIEEQRCVVRILWTTEHNAQVSLKEYFLFTVGKYLSRKAAHDWGEEFFGGRWKVADDGR
jgi:hypothetical protein